jgi:Trk-type K+ transport system membrane component
MFVAMLAILVYSLSVMGFVFLVYAFLDKLAAFEQHVYLQIQEGIEQRKKMPRMRGVAGYLPVAARPTEYIDEMM